MPHAGQRAIAGHGHESLVVVGLEFVEVVGGVDWFFGGVAGGEFFFAGVGGLVGVGLGGDGAALVVL